MAADWSEEVVEAVERWVATKRETNQDGGGWRRIGTATPRGDGWLLLDLRDGRANADGLGEPCFAGERGPERDPPYPVEEIRNVDGVLELREPPNLPMGSRHLWARSMSPRFLLESLLTGLRKAGPASLARALAEQRLAGPPTSRADVAGLLDAPPRKSVWRPGPGGASGWTRAGTARPGAFRGTRLDGLGISCGGCPAAGGGSAPCSTAWVASC